MAETTRQSDGQDPELKSMKQHSAMLPTQTGSSGTFSSSLSAGITKRVDASSDQRQQMIRPKRSLLREAQKHLHPWALLQQQRDLTRKQSQLGSEGIKTYKNHWFKCSFLFTPELARGSHYTSNNSRASGIWSHPHIVCTVLFHEPLTI